MLAIYKKEMRAYFNSIIGWLFGAFFLVFTGIYYYLYNLYYGYTNFGYSLSSISLIFILLVPMVTMRMVAEENKQKTDQLLLTSPVSVEKIILGKYLAVISLLAMVMVIVSVYPLILAAFGEVNFAMNYASILGFFLLGSAYMAVGMFISSLTESQAFAAVLTFIVVLFTYLMEGIAGLFSNSAETAWGMFAFLLLMIAVLLWITMKNAIVTGGFVLLSQGALAGIYFFAQELLDGSIANVFGWFSIATRYDNFVYGIFDVSAIVYYISIVVLFHFLTIQVIKKRRWN